MSGKKKKKKSKKKRNKNNIKKQVIDEDLKELGVRELYELERKEDAELESVRKDRNYFQLERDKVKEFWEISQKKVGSSMNQLKLIDMQVQESEEKHQVELKVYKQKIRHLLYEQKISVSQINNNNSDTLSKQGNEFLLSKQKLKEEKKKLKEEIKEKNVAHEKKVETLKHQHERSLKQEQDSSQKELQQVITNYEKKISQLKEDMLLRRHKEVDELESRKNSHLRQLISNHEVSFQNIKNYYKTITTNNLKLIKNLKKDYEEMKRNEEENENLIVEISQENKKLAEPLDIMKNEARDLQKELQNYKKDQLLLKQTKSRLRKKNDEMKKIFKELDNLRKKFDIINNERTEMEDLFLSTIHQVRQKTNFKNQLLEGKVETLKKELEKKKSLLMHVIQASDLPQNILEEMEINI